MVNYYDNFNRKEEVQAYVELHSRGSFTCPCNLLPYSGNTVQYGGKGEQKPSCNLQCPDDSIKLRHFEDYPIEDLQIPTLIFHAKDDKLASYNDTERALSRFPDCTFVSFENGGHLMEGHGKEIKRAVCDFVMKHD